MADLTQILDFLGTDNNLALNFLEAAYAAHPADVTIARELLARNPKISILEIMASKLKPVDDDLFLAIASKLIEAYNGGEWPHTVLSSISEFADQTGDDRVAAIALDALLSRPSSTHWHETYRLLVSYELAKQLGREDELVKLMDERAQLLVKEGSFFHAAGLYVRLGRPSDAIDCYLSQGSTQVALTVAKEHLPGRIREIAEFGFSVLDISHVDLYVESARILGREVQARRSLVNLAKQEISQPVKWYSHLVKFLYDLGEADESFNLVRSVEAHFKATRERFDFGEGLQDLGLLYNYVGAIESADRLYLEFIDWRLGYNFPVKDLFDNAPPRLVSTEPMLERKIRFYEAQGNYGRAAQSALMIPDRARAKIYKAMAQMVAKANK